MRALKPFSFLSAVVLLSSLLSTPPAVAQTPGDLMEELYTALTTPGRISTSKYLNSLSLDFNSWRVGGSQNLPVIAAATALIETSKPSPPPGLTLNQMIDWWTKFLTCQNNPGSCTVPTPASLVYFKSGEVFSYTYQWSVDASVLTVNWWAHRNNNPALQLAARIYLRKTWSLYGLAAGTGNADTYLDNTDAATGIVNDSVIFQHRCHRTAGGQVNYNGPFLALAATRSSPGFFCADDKAVLYSRAIAWPSLKANWERLPQKNVRTYLETNWPGNPYGESVYALNAGERQLLMEQMSQGSWTSTLLGVINSDGTRFQAPIHFLAWPGVRVSVIETTPALINNPGKTAFAVKYDAGLKQGHFLYPWNKDPSAPYRHGQAKLLPNATSPTQIEASSKRDDETVGPHGLHIVRFNVPATQPMYHVVVGPNGDGTLIP